MVESTTAVLLEPTTTEEEPADGVTGEFEVVADPAAGVVGVSTEEEPGVWVTGELEVVEDSAGGTTAVLLDDSP